MHARALAEQYPDLAVASFTPGVLPGTDIARDRDLLQHLLWRWLLPALAPVLPGVRSLARSSGDLAWLITEARLKPLAALFSTDAAPVRDRELPRQGQDFPPHGRRAGA